MAAIAPAAGGPPPIPALPALQGGLVNLEADVQTLARWVDGLVTGGGAFASANAGHADRARLWKHLVQTLRDMPSTGAPPVGEAFYKEQLAFAKLKIAECLLSAAEAAIAAGARGANREYTRAREDVGRLRLAHTEAAATLREEKKAQRDREAALAAAAAAALGGGGGGALLNIGILTPVALDPTANWDANPQPSFFFPNGVVATQAQYNLAQADIALPAFPVHRYWSVVDLFTLLDSINDGGPLQLCRTLIYDRPTVDLAALIPLDQRKVCVNGLPGVGKSVNVFLRSFQVAAHRPVVVVGVEETRFFACVEIINGIITRAWRLVGCSNGRDASALIRAQVVDPTALIIFDGAMISSLKSCLRAIRPWIAVCSQAAVIVGEMAGHVTTTWIDSWSRDEYIDAVINNPDFRHQVWPNLGSIQPPAVRQPTAASHAATATWESAEIAAEGLDDVNGPVVLALLNAAAVPGAGVANIAAHQDLGNNIIKAVVKAKEFYTGGSARWTFEREVTKALLEIETNIERVPYFTHAVGGHQGEYTAAAVNHLTRRSGGEKQFVSKYVQRNLSMKMTMEHLITALNFVRGRNRAFAGHVHELHCLNILDNEPGRIYMNLTRLHPNPGGAYNQRSMYIDWTDVVEYQSYADLATRITPADQQKGLHPLAPNQGCFDYAFFQPRITDQGLAPAPQAAPPPAAPAGRRLKGAAAAVGGGGAGAGGGGGGGGAATPPPALPADFFPHLILLQFTVSTNHSFKPLFVVRLIQSISETLRTMGVAPVNLELFLANLRIWHIAVIPNPPHADFNAFQPYEDAVWHSGAATRTWNITFWKSRMPVPVILA